MLCKKVVISQPNTGLVNVSAKALHSGLDPTYDIQHKHLFTPISLYKRQSAAPKLGVLSSLYAYTTFAWLASLFLHLC